MLLGTAQTPQLPEPAPVTPTTPLRATPKGWPRKPTQNLWAWMARRRPPLPILVAGAEGGVGTSTTCALVGEVLAAASPGPTVIVNQCGHGPDTLTRRLVGHQAGLPGPQAASGLRQHVPAYRVLAAAPRSSAGGHLVDDGPGFTELRTLYGLANTTCGGIVVDAGRVDTSTVLRVHEIRAVVLLVGRADSAGAESLCAALKFLRDRPDPIHPLVVLSSTYANSRVPAAKRLLTTAGVTTAIHLPFDRRLTTGSPLRLNRVSKSTATAALRAVTLVGAYHEVYGHVH
ncbi:hypothetical protein [Actinokineospora sp. UTMC 2448]|uniref:hypothetical protein n=1 Tax=Actinokineospora sp. UTMC 2448 TaxID=2268449 RepID=UPI0021642C40|nr:hypothetical protein [Actinokineospora sp. UTMC 2448]